MLRGIETVSSGLVADENWQEMLANDLAQLGTPGYKAQSPVVGSFAELLVDRTGPDAGAVGGISGGTAVLATSTDWSEGPMQSTGDPLNVAIEGTGFFAVRTPQGVLYTRAGDFSLDAQGHLVTPQGDFVLSQAGTPITARAGAAIAPDGTIGQGGGPSGTIGVFDPPLAQLTDTGGGLYRASGAAPLVAGARLVPGYLEGSNVSAPEVLAAMIQVLRHFQAGQQFISEDKNTIDRFLQVAG